ncbi:MAG: GNAT family N-acetyltransferase [Candidatus Heimdallarchaeota archaeon]
MIDIDIVPFNAQTASKDEWTCFLEFRRKRWAEHSPGDPIYADKLFRTWLREIEERDFVTEAHAVFETENPKTQIGVLRLAFYKEDSPSYKGNEKSCHVFDLAVLRPYRRKGIGQKLLPLVWEFARKHDKPLVIGSTQEEDGKAFLRKMAAQEALDAVESRLYLNKVNWEMIENWAKEGPKRSPNSRIEFFSSVPEEIIDPYCEIFTETLNQAPRQDLQVGDDIMTPEFRRKLEEDFRKNKAQWMTLITREENGDISGLTEMNYHPERHNMIEQLLTGVQEKYRGSGKGKWLKALMLLKIRKEFPQVEIVTTGNATTNEPMLAINQRLGFKKHKEWIVGQISVEKIEGFLAKNGLDER